MYISKAITKTDTCTIVNKQGKTLRKKYNIRLLKPFFSYDTTDSDEQRQLQKSNHNKKHTKDEEEEEDLSNKAFIEHKQDLQELHRNRFNKYPGKIAEMILFFVGKSSEQTLNITKQKMKFSIKDFFRKLRIWSHLLRNP